MNVQPSYWRNPEINTNFFLIFHLMYSDNLMSLKHLMSYTTIVYPRYPNFDISDGVHEYASYTAATIYLIDHVLNIDFPCL